MRRFWIFAVPPVALSLGVAAAIVFSVPDSRKDLSTSTTPAATAPESDGGSPRAHVALPLPDIDVAPIEPDPAWWRTSAAPGSVGVTWITREGSDPSNLLENDAQREMYDSLLSCFPVGASNEELFRAKTGCFDEMVIRFAASTPNPADVFSSIRALNTARPDVFTVCHNASHRVGEVALRRIIPVFGIDKDIIAALLDRGASACMGGLMHGTLDAVGLLVSEIPAFKPVVEACLLANPDNLGYCTDAVGHATWDAFGDISKAAEVCSFFETPRTRRECGEGILMRIYQRGETEDRKYAGNIVRDEDLEEWNSAIVDICESWPSTPFSAAAPENPQEWCWSGSVYLFFKPIFYSLSLAKGVIEEAYPAVSTRLAVAIEACGSFPAPGDDLCLERMGPSVGHAGGFEKSYAEKLCQLFPAPVVERCKKDALSRIEAAFNE